MVGAGKAEGEQQLVLLGNTWSMIAGDPDNNHIVNNQDYNFWRQNSGQEAVYHKADLNADGNVNMEDYDLWFNNRSKLGNFK